MKRKATRLRLSPNEEARIIREEYERRRKLRIQQVREQHRDISLQIRREVEQRRQRELEQLGKELREEWEQQQREKLNRLQKLYQESLQLLGQGHRSAKENEPDLAAIAKKEEENHIKAEERFREALKELKSQKLKDHERQSRPINARKKALQAEKERAAKVASLPLPPPNCIQNIDPKKPQIVKKSDASAFAATHYHMAESAVDREVDPKQPNAQEGAELEARRLQELQREEERRREEQLEKARLRGMQALRREHLAQDRERLLVELEHMQQTDMLRRRQQVSKMPPQIFQPLCKRQETREDFQREMEFAFEDMYTGERRVKGDLVVQLVPEPLPALSTGSQDQELDVTLEELASRETESSPSSTEQDGRSSEQETCARGEVAPLKPAPRRTLKKLLDRIRSQRQEWTEDSRRAPAADSPTAVADEILERDTTIDTGSLTSEEKDKELPTEPPEPPHSPAASGPTERPAAAAAEALPPDVLPNRSLEFAEERKKREEELEREKQEQVALLQELEEQKAKLEQMLLEARQEREHLKAAAAQEVSISRSGSPDSHQGVPPGLIAELTAVQLPPPGEDAHARRVREYQQRLLEQNRTHQRSVEVARQRLEEYQRALQLRYSTAAATLPPPPPPPPPPPFTHQHLHSARPVCPPAALPRHPTPAEPAHVSVEPPISVELPTRRSGILAPPPHPPGSSSRVCPGLLPEESVSDDSGKQRPDVSAWLTDSIMERVTEHLPEKVRPPSVTRGPLPYRQRARRSLSIPPPSTSDPFQTTGPSVTAGPGPAADEPHGRVPTGSQSPREDDVERRRRELQEAKRRVLEQSEAVALQQRQLEEKRRRQEEEMKEMRRQKETLQALIHTDAPPQPAAEAPTEEPPAEDIGQRRRRLLASLLRAIEETSGGTLSHLEDPQETEAPTQQPEQANTCETDPVCRSDVSAGPFLPWAPPAGSFPPPQTGKPPVTRIRQGVVEMMMQQHELSAIPEAETPLNTSQVAGPEDSERVPSRVVDWDPQGEPRPPVASDRAPRTPPRPGSGQQIAERTSSSGTSSGRSSQLVWRERLLMGAGTPPGSVKADSRIISPISSDSGRGADYSGPALTSYRSPPESVYRPPDSDCFSSTTISTGSYITTDPEQNLNTDKSPPPGHCVEQGGEGPLNVSSPSGDSVSTEDSLAAEHPALHPAQHPAQAIKTLFNDSSIQRIIDRYTKELNISLSTTGKTTADSGGSYVEEVSPQSSGRGPERRAEADGPASCLARPSDTAGSQRGDLQWGRAVDPISGHLSGVDASQAEGPEQDSFRPLIGQLTDQSSCLAADHGHSAMERLVGPPSAHSSMISQPPGLPASLSLDQSGWDSTLNEMIGRLARRDFGAGRVPSEQSSAWLDESRMRPLVGELDESAGQHSGSSGEGTHGDLVSTGTAVLSRPPWPPQAASVLGVDPQSQDQTSPVDQDPEQAEACDSFHPLLAEVTHNETADPSLTFHRPEHHVPDSPDDRGAPAPSGQFDQSPERLRTEEPTGRATAPPSFHESLSQLVTSQCRPCGSDHTASPPMETDVELTALSLSRFTLCDDAPAAGMPRPEGPFCQVAPEDLESEEWSRLKDAPPVAQKIMEAATEDGILEQSEITLVSLSDTTVQEQETAVTDEEDKHPDGAGEEGQRGRETQGTESAWLPDETPDDEKRTQPVTLLEFQWGPNRGMEDVCQQRRRALLQRSSHRVEEMKAKRALSKTQSAVRAPPEAREQSKAGGRHPPDGCKPKSEPRHKADIKSKEGRAEQHQPAAMSGVAKQKKVQLPAPVSESRLKSADNVKSCTPEQRKLDVSEMHQRTQRLYEQLEEVKHQKAIRSRQEASAKNRLKAKEFHKKTLQKLRAKQTLQRPDF